MGRIWQMVPLEAHLDGAWQRSRGLNALRFGRMIAKAFMTGYAMLLQLLLLSLLSHSSWASKYEENQCYYLFASPCNFLFLPFRI
jgi:hypothetical protein